MNGLYALAERWGDSLWSLSWQLAVLIFAVWVVSLFCRRQSASFRYLLWCVVLLRLCLPVNISMPIGVGGHVEEVAEASWSAVFEESQEIATESIKPLPVVEVKEQVKQLPVKEAPVAVVEQQHSVVSVPQEPRREALPLNQSLVMLWGGLVILFTGLVVSRIIRVYFFLRRCLPVSDPAFLEPFDALRRQSGVRQKVKVYACGTEAKVGAPCVFGLFRPCILIPLQMIEEWDAKALEPVLLHELAHIKRFDLVVNAFQIVAQVLFFFHPLVWFANHRIRHERELACDDLAIAHCGSRRKQYSQSILRVVEEAQQGGTAFACASIGITEQRSSLGKRIVRIMGENYRQHKRMGVLSILLLLGLSALCVAVASEKVEQKPEVGVGINVQLPWSDRCVGDASPLWRYEHVGDGYRLINPDLQNPAIVRYPVSLWIWPKKLSIMELTYRAEGLDTEHPDKPVIVFSRENSDDVTVLFMRDLKVDGKKHMLRIDLTEQMAEMTIRKQRLGSMDLRVHTGKTGEGWLELAELRFEPRDGVKLPPEKKQDFLTHVRVVDLAGEPVPGATVTLDSHLLNCTVEVQTDQEGRVAIEPVVQGGLLLQRLIQIEKEGYTTVFFGNDYALGKNRKAEVVVILGPGQTVGGIVVDEEGNPLSHVAGEVWMHDEPNRDAKGFAWVRENERVVTDAEGRWTYPSLLKGSDVDFQIRWQHKGYCLDQWGGHYSGRLEQAALQAHTARSVLKRAILLEGRVMDSDGNPIKNAKIAQGKDQFPSNHPPITHTDEDGRYSFDNVPPGELILTITAEGFAPQLIKTEADGPKMEAVDFALEPGNPFRFRVVDTEGQPIKGVHICPDTWKECRTIRGRVYTDENGEAIWMGPPDPVEIHIFVEGKLDQRDQSYSPSKSEDDVHVVVLKEESKVVILVTDAKTDEPIPAFKVEFGERGEGDEKWYPRWSSNSQFLPVGKKGRWEHAFSDNYHPYRAFRIQAEGYLPAETKKVSVKEELVELQVKLMPGKNMEGTMLSPDGAPVEGAMVILLEAEGQIYAHGGLIDDYRRKATAISGSSGNFSFPPQGEPYRMFVSCPEGYWTGDKATFEDAGRIVTLKPWATVSGQVLVGDQPVPDQLVGIWSKHSNEKTQISYWLDVECDSEGRFVQNQVPAGTFNIGRKVKSSRGNTISGGVDYEIEAGQQLELQIGGTGRAVTGTCGLNPDASHVAGISLIKTKIEGGKRTRIYPTSYQARAGANGLFRIENVQPGDYDLTASVIEPRKDKLGNPRDRGLGGLTLQVEVPELPDGVEYQETPVDVGSLDMNVSNDGRQVIGQCQWEGEEKHTTYVYLTETNLKDGELRRSYNADEGENGEFSIVNVEPGRYELTIKVYVRRDAKGNDNPFRQRLQVGELKIEIEVPELADGAKPETPVDLGELKIEPTAAEKAP